MSFIPQQYALVKQILLVINIKLCYILSSEVGESLRSAAYRPAAAFAAADQCRIQGETDDEYQQVQGLFEGG